MIKSILICFVAVFMFNGLLAQNDLSTELWTGLTAKHKLNKKWSLSGEYQLRITEKEFEFENQLLEFTARKKLSKSVALKFGLRYTWLEEHRNHQRYFSSISKKWKVKPLKIYVSLRSKGQLKRVETTRQLIVDWRNRVLLEKKINKRWSTKLAYENFVRLYKFESISHTDKPEFSKNRYTFGIEYAKKNIAFETFYRFESDLNSKKKNNVQIIGLNLAHAF